MITLINSELYAKQTGRVTCILCMDHIKGYKCDHNNKTVIVVQNSAMIALKCIDTHY